MRSAGTLQWVRLSEGLAGPLKTGTDLECKWNCEADD